MSISSESEDATRTSQSSAVHIECADAARLTAAFVNGGLERKAVRLLHSHLDTCEDCRINYRESLEAAGRLGAGLRESMKTPEGRENSLERNKRIVGLAAAVGKRKRSPFALRALLLTAGMVVAAGWMAKIMDFPNPAEVYWVQGEVGVAEATLGSESGGEQLVASNWCWTGANSRARIEVGDTVLELGSGTQVQLESRKKLNFRLRSGTLVVEGPCEVLTVKGAVRVHSGTASIGFEGRQLVIENSGGEVEYFSSMGSHTINSGDPPFIVD